MHFSPLPISYLRYFLSHCQIKIGSKSWLCGKPSEINISELSLQKTFSFLYSNDRSRRESSEKPNSENSNTVNLNDNKSNMEIQILFDKKVQFRLF